MNAKPLFFVLVLIGMIAVASARPAISEDATIHQPDAIESVSIVKIFVDETTDFDRLRSTVELWDHNRGKDFLLAEVSPAQYQALRTTSFQYEIDSEYTALRQVETNALLPGQGGGIPGFPCYRTVEETHTTIQDIATNYPDLAQLIDIGDTWDKVTPGGNAGYDIYSLVLTNQSASVPTPKPRLMIMAATHAREYTTAETATRFAEMLVTEYDTNPDVTWLLDYFEVHIVPQANPDGRKLAEQTDIWHRKNANTTACGSGNLGIDLNRNMPWAWGSSISQCSDAYPGTSPASEPENAALVTYIQNLWPDLRGTGPNDAAPSNLEGVFITIHSSGGLILPVWAHTNVTSAPNTTEIFTLGRKMGHFTNYDVCGTGQSGCLGAAAGTHDDFAYGDLGVPGYTFELGTSFHQSCTAFEGAGNIYEIVEDALFYTFKATRRPYQNPSGPDIYNLMATGGSATEISVSAGTQLTLNAIADDTRYDNGSQGIEPTQNIQAVRYSVDEPSWISGVTLTPMAPADGAFNAKVETAKATVDTTGWTMGRHIIFVEGQDVDGNWGVPTAYFVNITQPPTAISLTNTASGTASVMPILITAIAILLTIPLCIRRQQV